MKILPLLIVMAFSTMAHALSFTWASSAKISYNGETTTASAGGITASLIYLGPSSAISITDYSVAGPVAGTTTTKSSGMSVGKYTATFDQELGSQIGSGTFSAGDYFTVLLTYTDAGTTWYNLAAAQQVPTSVTDISTGTKLTFTHDSTMQDKGTALSAGGGWVAAAAVPEPATGALALAGIALLFKRRKARA